MLLEDILLSEVRKLNDNTYSEFIEFPKDCIEATEKWSEALYKYTQNIVPLSTTAILAKDAMKNQLQGICSSVSLVDSATIFESAILQFAQVLGNGMQASQFTSIPPSSSLNLATLFLESLAGGGALNFATKLTTKLDSWFKTGVAVQNITGVSVNWS